MPGVPFVPIYSGDSIVEWSGSTACQAEASYRRAVRRGNPPADPEILKTP